ncbi:MAG: TldD/PmbA family protein [Bacilli bacterium]|nr:TldD/PmbA family protein [Bacilli bacterium]
MKKEFFEEIINLCLSKGADYADIYLEEKETKSIILRNSQLDNISISKTKGIGIRIGFNHKVFYASTSNIDKENIINIANDLCKNIDNKNKTFSKISLEETSDYYIPKISHNSFSIESKKDILKDIDKIVRNYSPLINQVEVILREEEVKYTTATSKGILLNTNSMETRLNIASIAKKDDRQERCMYNHGSGKGYEMFEDFDYKKLALDNAINCIDKLNSVNFKGGELPVILGNGFGGVIFHEACVHGLEATSVAPGFSVFKEDLNKQIASKKVTIIDDGSITGEWGSTLYDTEGNKTKKNTLIEKGILKSFLVDELNKDILNHEITSSSRRENYRFAPTSRMNNTYLEKGNDNFEDMVKSINLGVYCKTMSGGSVNPATGDFNFAVEDAFLIEDGQLTKRIKGITLIGNSKDILNKVEMVGDDLTLASGYCGSDSGMIPVTIGQPTIKISKILVGGRDND